MPMLLKLTLPAPPPTSGTTFNQLHLSATNPSPNHMHPPPESSFPAPVSPCPQLLFPGSSFTCRHCPLPATPRRLQWIEETPRLGAGPAPRWQIWVRFVRCPALARSPYLIGDVDLDRDSRLLKMASFRQSPCGTDSNFSKYPIPRRQLTPVWRASGIHSPQKAAEPEGPSNRRMDFGPAKPNRE